MKTATNKDIKTSSFFSEANNRNFYPGYYAPDESPFLGIGEGKWKERREQRKAEKEEEQSNSSSSSSGSSGSSSGSNSGLLTSIVGGIFSVAGQATPLLPSLGIGSKSRIKEAQALGEIQYKSDQAQASTEKQKLVIGGVFILLILVVVVFSLKE